LFHRRFPRPALIALALVVALSGCRSNRERDTMLGAPDLLYNRARELMDNRDYNSAVKVYEALEARFPFAPQARQGKLDLMYVYYKSREPEAAVDAAEQFVRENPTHPRVDYALYIKGLVYFERTANFLERWFDADLSERPPRDARKSFQAFSELIERFPDSQYGADSRQRLVYLRNRLADYEVHVADYYLRRGAWVAALNRAKFCVENYDGAPATREAVAIQIAAYDELGLQDLATQMRGVYEFNYASQRPEMGAGKKKRWWKFW
jgi:outer membrane protein assembly factor BamD